MLGARFATWDPRVAARRGAVTASLSQQLGLGEWDGLPQLAATAARLLDTGSSIGFYNRKDHAATIIEEGDLEGFTHRQIAFLSAITLQAQRSLVDIEDFRPLLTGKDEVPVLQAGTVVALAEEIEHRLPASRRPDFTVRNARERVVIASPALAAWKPGWLADRFELAFGRELSVTSD
jgi:exopolyphosphatase/pppGpp-phosphohydrolase